MAPDHTHFMHNLMTIAALSTRRPAADCRLLDSSLLVRKAAFAACSAVMQSTQDVPAGALTAMPILQVPTSPALPLASLCAWWHHVGLFAAILRHMCFSEQSRYPGSEGYKCKVPTMKTAAAAGSCRFLGR